jgi:hypothetical protein
MPHSKRASIRRSRAQQTAKSRLKKVASLALEMEVPLNDATDLVHALRLIGGGMTAGHDDGGRPINALAWSALHHIETLRIAWKAIHKAARNS